MIEVYNDNEIKKLKNEVVDINWSMFKQIESLGLASNADDNLDDDVFEFTNEKYNDVLANEIEKELEMTAEDETFLQDDGDVDVDDI